MRAVYDGGHESCDSNLVVATLSSDVIIKPKGIEKAQGFIDPPIATDDSPIRRAVANFAAPTVTMSLPPATAQPDPLSSLAPQPSSPTQQPLHHEDDSSVEVDTSCTIAAPSATSNSNTDTTSTSSQGSHAAVNGTGSDWNRSRSLPSISSERVKLYRSSLYNSTGLYNA